MRLLAPLSVLVLLVGVLAVRADTLLIRGARIVDVGSGTVSDGDVLIEAGTIGAVGPDIDAPGAEVLEAEGRWLIPGLWDVHVHVISTPTEADTALPLYLLNGVTGIRDMGALVPVEAQMALAAELEEGTRLGPRLIVSGAWVDAPPGSWPGMFLAATPAEASAVVGRIASEGWAAVKAYSMLSKPVYQALAAAAEAEDLPLVGHIPETITLRDAIVAGQDGVEHWGRITRACAEGEDGTVAEARSALEADDPLAALMSVMAGHNAIVLETWDEARCRAILTEIAAAGIHVSPTFVVAGFYLGLRPDREAPRMRTLPTEVREAWDRPDFRLDAMTDEIRAQADASIALDRRTFAMAVAAGVPILASTDASFANPWLFHGASLADELAIYVESGMTERQALFAATAAPPRFFGLPDQDGRIAPGRRADLVLLGSDPLADIAEVREVEAVVVRGTLLNSAALGDMRARLEALGR